MKRGNKGKGKRWNQCPVLDCENPMGLKAGFCWTHLEQLPQAVKDGLRDANDRGDRLEWLRQHGIGSKHFAELAKPSLARPAPDYNPMIGEKPLTEAE